MIDYFLKKSQRETHFQLKLYNFKIYVENVALERFCCNLVSMLSSE